MPALGNGSSGCQQPNSSTTQVFTRYWEGPPLKLCLAATLECWAFLLSQLLQVI
jgi:hypothetical protein